MSRILSNVSRCQQGCHKLPFVYGTKSLAFRGCRLGILPSGLCSSVKSLVGLCKVCKSEERQAQRLRGSVSRHRSGVQISPGQGLVCLRRPWSSLAVAPLRSVHSKK
ncbi:hypothetical protein TNCV_593041 [Trichonephila clavipes]|nr:hypothetical protein TNCV_593041 [Trichonephila clavipes]